MLQLIKKRKTPSREIEILCKVKVVKASQLLRYMDIKKVQEKCRNGCPNYNKKWSCPPFSLSYDKVSSKYNNAIIISFSTSMDKYIDIKNKYLAIKAANVTLKCFIEKVSRKIEKEVNGYSLLSGSCRLCKPCQCKQQKSCKRSEDMRYSMEATYLDVSALTKEILSHELLWYENKVLPKYTSTVTMILTNQDITDNQIKQFISIYE